MSYHYQDKLIKQFKAGRRMGVSAYGSGKCRMSLLATWELCPPSGLIVVLCPSRNLRTWMADAVKWLPGEAKHVEVDPHAPQIATAFRCQNPDKHLLVLSQRSLRSLIDHLAYLAPFAVILDESTVIKNPRSNVSVHAHKLARGLPNTMRICLAGNPTPEHPSEIWSQFEFCYAPNNPLGRTYYKFLNQFFLRADHQWALRLDREEELMRIFDLWSARMDEEDLEEHKLNVGVEEKYQTVLYQASNTQKALMEQLQLKWSLPSEDSDSGVDEYWHTMSILHKSLQIADGFYYTSGDPALEKKKPIRLTNNPKAYALHGLINDLVLKGHRRIVVWHQYRADRFEIESWIRQHWQVLGDRESDFDQFMLEPSPYESPLVIVLPLACARGINDLITASVGIFFSNSFRQEIRDQAEKRLPRPGQKNKTVLHIDLACTELADHRVVMALQNKAMNDQRCNEIVTEMFGIKEAKV